MFSAYGKILTSAAKSKREARGRLLSFWLFLAGKSCASVDRRVRTGSLSVDYAFMFLCAPDVLYILRGMCDGGLHY